MLKRTIPSFAAVAIAMSLAAPTSPGFAQGMAKSNQFWWPDQLDLGPLRDHDAKSNPLGEDFDYAKAFESVDLKALKADIEKALTGLDASFYFIVDLTGLEYCINLEWLDLTGNQISNLSYS